MIIDLSSFLDENNELIQFKGNLNVEEFNLGGRDIVIVGPVEYEGEVFKVDDGKAIDIRVNFIYSEVCHRCLTPTRIKIRTMLSGKLVKGKEEIDSEYDGYDELLYYENDILDPEEYVLNHVILSLPMKSLCKYDCKGLCPTCGADLNNTICNCIQENIDPRLEKLKKFFPKN